jgi:hypothetical protein
MRRRLRRYENFSRRVPLTPLNAVPPKIDAETNDDRQSAFWSQSPISLTITMHKVPFPLIAAFIGTEEASSVSRTMCENRRKSHPKQQRSFKNQEKQKESNGYLLGFRKCLFWKKN